MPHPNKEQTEQLMNLGFSIILLTLSLFSVYAFITGIYLDIFDQNSFLSLILTVATILGMVFGVIFIVISVYRLNEARVEK